MKNKVAVLLIPFLSFSAGADESLKKALVTGGEPGFVAITWADLVNVNCAEGTWTWKDDMLWCTGKPTGVIRSKKEYTNFELVCEWRHHKHGGNSGVFVWARKDVIDTMHKTGKPRLPKGIEVQVLDLGYAEVYTQRHKKPPDWFTSHGDVFPVGAKMKPFPPVAPNGSRSFPSKNLTKGLEEWNHYYIRAINGEVRLWVNGEEVSGGTECNPRSGYLCFESEGAPIEFRNIRLRELPDAPVPPVPVAVAPVPAPLSRVDLKGHPAVGTWYYSGHSREITPSGVCILRNGNQIIWKRAAISKSADSVVLAGNLSHVLKGDTLHIEGRYRATRTAP